MDNGRAVFGDATTLSFILFIFIFMLTLMLTLAFALAFAAFTLSISSGLFRINGVASYGGDDDDPVRFRSARSCSLVSASWRDVGSAEWNELPIGACIDETACMGEFAVELFPIKRPVVLDTNNSLLDELLLVFTLVVSLGFSVFSCCCCWARSDCGCVVPYESGACGCAGVACCGEVCDATADTCEVGGEPCGMRADGGGDPDGVVRS